MRKYNPKPVTIELVQQVRRERPDVGLKEIPDRMPVNPKKHVNVKWACEYCGARFFYRPEAVCNRCGLCQTCGLFYDDPFATGCICGNHIPEDSPPIPFVRVRANVNVLTEAEKQRGV